MLASPLWRSKEPRARQSLHDLPPNGRLVASRRPNSAPDHGDIVTGRGLVIRDAGIDSRKKSSALAGLGLSADCGAGTPSPTRSCSRANTSEIGAAARVAFGI